jgi:hypothetical protein
MGTFPEKEARPSVAHSIVVGKRVTGTQKDIEAIYAVEASIVTGKVVTSGIFETESEISVVFCSVTLEGVT